MRSPPRNSPRAPRRRVVGVTTDRVVGAGGKTISEERLLLLECFHYVPTKQANPRWNRHTRRACPQCAGQRGREGA